ncbi:hypothetical protein ACVWZM_006031 [Bradyrhizobium sp. USDA 4501]
MSRSRKAGFIAGIAFGCSVIAASLAHTGVSLTKYWLEHGPSITEAVKSTVEHAENVVAAPAEAKVPPPDQYLVMGYNKDSDPLQTWRVTERKRLADGTETGVIVTEKNVRHPFTAYHVDGFYMIDYRPGEDSNPGFGRFYFRVSAKGNRAQAGRGIVLDCACHNGAITANANVSDVPAMLLTSGEITDADRRLLLSVDVQTAVPQSSLDKLIKDDK